MLQFIRWLSRKTSTINFGYNPFLATIYTNLSFFNNYSNEEIVSWQTTQRHHSCNLLMLQFLYNKISYFSFIKYPCQRTVGDKKKEKKELKRKESIHNQSPFIRINVAYDSGQSTYISSDFFCKYFPCDLWNLV